MKTLLLGSFVALVAFAGIFTGFYWWQFHELPSFGQAGGTSEPPSITPTNPVSVPLASVSPQPSPTAAVLGANSEYVLPSTLYGLINGLRRDIGTGVLIINPVLETTAQRLILAASDNPQDPAELAKKLGFQGKDVVLLQANSGASAWEAFSQFQADQRAEMLLKSKTITDIGAALVCEENANSRCTTYVILGTR